MSVAESISCIYEGNIAHRRLTPVTNCFEYSTFMMYLDLDELPQLFASSLLWSPKKPALAWFRREDYHGDSSTTLKAAVLDTVEGQLGFRPDGPVRMLAHLRYFGFCFNPVSFYYCYSTTGELQVIMAEITNTPWKDRHSYCLDWRLGDGDRREFDFDKQFHVSPFMAMAMSYMWCFSAPGPQLTIFMANIQEGGKVFDALLRLERREISPWRLNFLLLRHPFHTLKVVAGIYWQAVKLKIKGAPFFQRPDQVEIANRE